MIKFFAIIILAIVLAPAQAFAQTVPSPIPGATTIIDVIFTVLIWALGIFGIITMAFLVWNGLRLIYSRGNDEALAKAKEGTTWAVYGFVFAVLSFSIISATATFLGSTGVDELQNPDQVQSPIGATDFEGAITTIINGFLGVAFVLAVIMIVYSGYRMIFSAGNEEQVTKAKTILRWAIIGIIVIVLSYAILNGINLLFGLQ